MTPLPYRHTFDQIVEAAQSRERHHFELKNSSYVVVDHPAANNRGTARNKSNLPDLTKRMLARECGAFANSSGGTLVIGFNDDGSLDDILVPILFDNSNTPIERWVECLIKASVEPPIENFDCYTVSDKDGRIVLVVEVPVSDKAPHQSRFDRLYYIRQGTTSAPAEHWLIEMIRNRRTHPKLEASFDLVSSYIHTVSGDNSVALYLSTSVSNQSAIMANSWAMRVDCQFASETRVQPEAEYIRLILPHLPSKATWMVNAIHPVFPTQVVNMIIKVVVRCEYLVDASQKSLVSFKWKDLGMAGNDAGWISEDGLDQEFYVDVSIFADSGPKEVFRFSVKNMDFFPKMLSYLQKEGRL